MYPRPLAVCLRLTPAQAEAIYWELTGSLGHYKNVGTQLEASDEQAILLALGQLELGLKRAEAVAAVQLEHLRKAVGQDGAATAA